MPDWFKVLNRYFRYTLTVIDTDDSNDFVQAKVVREMKDNRFVLRTSAPGTKVSWMVTGIRQDDYANAHRIPVEEDKPSNERGYYLYPKEAGVAAERGISSRQDVRAASGSLRRSACPTRADHSDRRRILLEEQRWLDQFEFADSPSARVRLHQVDPCVQQRAAPSSQES
jgi:hypothetical protein